jgi:hypothetical protein
MVPSRLQADVLQYWVLGTCTVRRWLILVCIVAVFIGTGTLADSEVAESKLSEADHFFLEQVRPLLASRCLSCHGPDKAEGGLRLDSREATLKGGDSGPALVPGKPEESLLLLAVKRTHKILEMPPEEKLASRDVATLERWIREGAPWPPSPSATDLGPAAPREPIGDAWTDPRNPIVQLFGGQRLDLWSLKPLKRPEVPRSVVRSLRERNHLAERDDYSD